MTRMRVMVNLFRHKIFTGRRTVQDVLTPEKLTHWASKMGNLTMKPQNMFGVVLWSDAAARKAVIWCEDQGELAFYTPGEGSIHDAPVLDAGDLISFEMIVQQNVRKVSNPQVLMASHSPDLPQKLRDGTSDTTRDPVPLKKRSPEKSEKVVSLSERFGVAACEKVACSG